MSRFSRWAALVLVAGTLTGLLAIHGVNAQSPQAKPAGAKTTEDVFKNIQILKGVPADQLMPTMQFMAASLGVQCDFCHVQGAFEKDDKKPKQTARTMMQMMFAINKDHFEGHRDVTCYSCHHGNHDPVSIPLIEEAEAKPPMPPQPAAAEQKLPSADELLDKYVQAVGGADALKKVSSRVEKGSATIFGGRQVPVQVFTKAPDKRAAVMQIPGGESVTAYDGQVGWMGAPRMGPREVMGGELDALKLDADFSFPADAKQVLGELKVESQEPIDGNQAYLVVGRHEAAPPVKLYFDAQTGLLLRQVRYLETPLGRFPTQIDYSDYRDSGGVKIPFKWSIARPGNRFAMQMESVEANVPVDDSKFAKPPAPPAPPAK